ncbi:MAG: hypothetical protein GY791_08355 [Alphaproteobacteria bacterium]|nr:hypothetical protein [Alphaproteobacteria bacterium]
MSGPIVPIGLAALGLLGGIQQAATAEQSARAAELTAQSTADRERRDGRRQLGLRRARAGASGLGLEGAPLEVLADTAAEIELAAQDAIFRGAVQANARRNEGRGALFRGISSAGKTLLTSDFS